MSEQVFRYVEVLNRLKRGTTEGRVLWRHDSPSGGCYESTLDNGHIASLGCLPGGSAVLFTLSGPDGLETLHLESIHVADDLLRLALLQLFVTVRDSCALRLADAALDAVRDL